MESEPQCDYGCESCFFFSNFTFVTASTKSKKKLAFCFPSSLVQSDMKSVSSRIQLFFSKTWSLNRLWPNATPKATMWPQRNRKTPNSLRNKWIKLKHDARAHHIVFFVVTCWMISETQDPKGPSFMNPWIYFWIHPAITVAVLKLLAHPCLRMLMVAPPFLLALTSGTWLTTLLM